MRYVVSYDISNDKIRGRIVKVCETYGQRVQYSIFECELNREQKEEMIKKLNKVRNGSGKEPSDSVRVYAICSECSDKVQVLGFKPKIITETNNVVIG